MSFYGALVRRSYTVTRNLGPTGFYRNIASIEHPAATVQLAERTMASGDGGGNWIAYSVCDNLGSELAWRHNDTANFLYCDGHVKAQSGKTGGPYPNLPGYTAGANGPLCTGSDPLPQ